MNQQRATPAAEELVVVVEHNSETGTTRVELEDPTSSELVGLSILVGAVLVVAIALALLLAVVACGLFVLLWCLLTEAA